MMSSDLKAMLASASPTVRVAITETRGSSPREAGAEIYVTKTSCAGTIGGGQLEYRAIQSARKVLQDGDLSSELSIPLGPEIGQCCGGRVTLSLTRMTTNERREILRRSDAVERAQPHIYIFGSGHVGRAVADQFQHLPFRTIIVDQRERELAQCHAAVVKRLSALPEEIITLAPPGSAFIVLTHGHGLDFLLTGVALDRGDAAYVGLIGSQTKRTKFEKWHRKHSDTTTPTNLTCPIGKSETGDKRPEIIASFVVAEVIATLSHHQSTDRLATPINTVETTRSLHPNRQMAIQAGLQTSTGLPE